jgi:hypothetical protein
VAVQAAEEFAELLRIGKSDGRAGAAELVTTVETFEASEELAAKDAAEDLHGQEDKDSVGGSKDDDLARVRPREWRNECGDAGAGSVPRCEEC